MKESLKSKVDVILRIGLEAATILRGGGKILFFGNGGSAADAQHLAAELVGTFKRNRMGLAAVALTTDSSILTSVGNDLAFEHVFARQVEALARKDDMVIGISTSGRSQNVILGISAANKLGASTAALTGGDGGILAKRARLALIVPSHETQRIQESHIMIGHIICRIIEDELFSSKGR